MKTIVSAVLGLTMTLAAAGLSFAQQTPAPAPAGNTAKRHGAPRRKST